MTMLTGFPDLGNPSALDLGALHAAGKSRVLERHDVRHRGMCRCGPGFVEIEFETRDVRIDEAPLGGREHAELAEEPETAGREMTSSLSTAYTQTLSRIPRS
jgi:hypothetical protein